MIHSPPLTAEIEEAITRHWPAGVQPRQTAAGIKTKFGQDLTFEQVRQFFITLSHRFG